MPTTSKGLRYPASSAAPNGPQQIQDLATDVDAKLFANGGTSGTFAGTSPPAGTALIVKTYRGTVSTNVSGDATVSFPGGAFPNGLVSVTTQAVVASPISWNPTSSSTSAVNMRAYALTTGAAAGSLAIDTIVTAIGW